MSGFDLTQALSNFHCTWWGLSSITLEHVAPPTPPPSSPDPPLLNNVFLHLSVNLFTGGGVFPIACWDTPPLADTTPPYTMGHGQQQEGGTHPAGMHTCF